MQPLEKLFGSKQRIRLMRLFLMHQDQAFMLEEIVKKTKIRKETVRLDLAWLLGSSVVKKTDKKVASTSKRSLGTKKIVSFYALDMNCVFREELYAMLAATGEHELTELESRFKKAGTVDLLIASGFFMQKHDSRLDLLIAGKKLKKSKIEEIINSLEAEIGRELVYASFETADFLYRAHMYDKLIRDVIDFSHIKVVDKGVLSKVPKMAS